MNYSQATPSPSTPLALATGFSAPVLTTENLTKVFNRHTVVDSINLTLQPAEIYGFLGPNGAGKTTTLRMILGLLPPTSGQVCFMGQAIEAGARQIRARFGVVGQEDHFFEYSTAAQYLRFFGEYYAVPQVERRIMDLLTRLDLLPFANLLAAEFSHGMKRKLSLARALLHQPTVLVLDEPSAGLDPFGIFQVRQVLEEQRQRGASILISSHTLSEIERLADRVGVLHQGKLLLEDTVEAVRLRLAPEASLDVELEAPLPGIEQELRAVVGVTQVEVQGARLRLRAAEVGELRAMVSQAITGRGGVIVGMQWKKADLEEAFIRITNERLTRLQREEEV